MMNWARIVIAAVVAVVLDGAIGRGGEFVWLEGEAGRANVQVNNSGWGNAHFLSEGKWMHISVDAEKVDAEVKADAAVIQYAFDAGKAGAYEVWSRIGFEFVRSLFEWRIDEGAWKAISPDDLTTDLMEIAFFCEVAWIHMGDVQLAAGRHNLEIRIPKGKEPSQESILDAAMLAAHYSKKKTDTAVEVTSTYRKYVTKAKDAGPGKVFVAQGRTILVRLDEKRLERLFSRE